MNTFRTENPFLVDRLNDATNFRAEWDVPAINDAATSAIIEQIEQLRGRTEPDPQQRILVLKGAVGRGKTHLFGRIAHELREGVFVVFVTPFEDLRRPLDHIRWCAIESLFDGQPSAWDLALARICQPSFIEYFDWLPAPLRAQNDHLGNRLREDFRAVIEVTAHVHELGPYLKLSESIISEHESLDASVVRALSLAWSPARQHVRRWLRGESLGDTDRERLKLPDAPPQAGKVLRAVATLLSHQMPIVVCCDQIEAVLSHENGALQISSDLMSLLQSVPNLLVALSCLEAEWETKLRPQVYTSFLDRCTELGMDDFVSVQQGIDLIRRRIASCSWAKSDRPLWPFSRESLKGWIAENQPGPRALVKTCAERYADWLDAGKLDSEIDIDAEARKRTPLEDQFRVAWENELQVIRKDPKKTPQHTQESRLDRALREALGIIRSFEDWNVDGVSIQSVMEDILPQPKNGDHRYGHKLTLDSGSGSFKVIVALTKLEGAGKFRYFLDALLSSIDGDVIGSTLIHHRDDLPAGQQKTRDKVNAAIDCKSLRPFYLIEHLADFERLECFLTFLDRAAGRELLFDDHELTPDDCRKLVASLGLLDDLKLFEVLLAGWQPKEETPESGSEAPSRSLATPATPTEVSASSQLDAEAQGIATHVASLDATGWAEDRLQSVVQQLRALNVKVRAVDSQTGARFARLVVQPLGSTTIGRVRARAEDLKIRLELQHCPIIDSQAGGISVDVQLPQPLSRVVDFGEVVSSSSKETCSTIFPLGQDVGGNNHWLDLADPNNCHVLVAGMTGSGKSEFLKVLLGGLACRHSPEKLQFVLIDPKRVTFNFGDRPSPYFRNPIGYDIQDALPLVESCLAETEHRYQQLSQRGYSDLRQWQEDDHTAPPRIVVVFDEFADLMADSETKKKLETPLRRVGAIARAAGIHLILATQRPEASVITPLLRSNLPGRISFRVSSKADSEMILGRPEAADLLGKGDLLWKHGGGLRRLQSPLISQDELEVLLRIA